jgi:hypothetical protein
MTSRLLFKAALQKKLRRRYFKAALQAHKVPLAHKAHKA